MTSPPSMGTSPFEALMTVVLADDLRTTFARSAPDPSAADWDARLQVWRDPRALIGASDAGAHLDMIAAFRYATGFLQEAVRERSLLPLEEAIHRLTQAPARLYGLRDRRPFSPRAHALTCWSSMRRRSARAPSAPASTSPEVPAGCTPTPSASVTWSSAARRSPPAASTPARYRAGCSARAPTPIRRRSISDLGRWVSDPRMTRCGHGTARKRANEADVGGSSPLPRPPGNTIVPAGQASIWVDQILTAVDRANPSVPPRVARVWHGQAPRQQLPRLRRLRTCGKRSGRHRRATRSPPGQLGPRGGTPGAAVARRCARS